MVKKYTLILTFCKQRTDQQEYAIRQEYAISLKSMLCVKKYVIHCSLFVKKYAVHYKCPGLYDPVFPWLVLCKPVFPSWVIVYCMCVLCMLSITCSSCVIKRKRREEEKRKNKNRLQRVENRVVTFSWVWEKGRKKGGGLNSLSDSVWQLIDK